MLEIEAGPFELGDGGEGFAYDNERPRHAVELAAFAIDRTPVANATYIRFMGETGAEPPANGSETVSSGAWLKYTGNDFRSS